jgi:hypothetical protein
LQKLVNQYTSGTFIPTFIAGKFTLMKQAIQQPINELKVWYSYTVWYYSSQRRTKLCFCRQMSGSRNYHVERDKPNLKRQISHLENIPKMVTVTMLMMISVMIVMDMNIKGRLGDINRRGGRRK